MILYLDEIVDEIECTEARPGVLLERIRILIRRMYVESGHKPTRIEIGSRMNAWLLRDMERSGVNRWVLDYKNDCTRRLTLVELFATPVIERELHDRKNRIRVIVETKG